MINLTQMLRNPLPLLCSVQWPRDSLVHHGLPILCLLDNQPELLVPTDEPQPMLPRQTWVKLLTHPSGPSLLWSPPSLSPLDLALALQSGGEQGLGCANGQPLSVAGQFLGPTLKLSASRSRSLCPLLKVLSLHWSHHPEPGLSPTCARV